MSVPEKDLLPCPFCGGKATYLRTGTAKRSCIIECSECGCSLETGEVWTCGQAWNTRHRPLAMDEGAGDAMHGKKK